MKLKRFLLSLLLIALLATIYTPFANAYSYAEVFSNVVSTINWNSPTASWYAINSKWQQPRNVDELTSTNPHRGVDILAPYGTSVKAVWAGWTTQVSTYGIRLRIDINNDGVQNDTPYYCYYDHLSMRLPNNYYAKGATIGSSGDNGGLYGAHLHFGGQSSSSIWCRNEVNYRWTSSWSGGKDVDAFSNQLWYNSTSTAQVTAYFKDENGTYTPAEVRIFHRQHGTSTWTNGGTMTNAGNYTYTYSFTGRYPSGTSVDWLVRIQRSGLGTKYSYCWAPAKYSQPAPTPSSAYQYPYYQNTVS